MFSCKHLDVVNNDVCLNLFLQFCGWPVRNGGTDRRGTRPVVRTRPPCQTYGCHRHQSSQSEVEWLSLFDLGILNWGLGGGEGGKAFVREGEALFCVVYFTVVNCDGPCGAFV